MKVLIVSPSLLEFEPNKEFTPPLSVLYLGGVLSAKNVDVSILDLSTHRVWDSPDGWQKASENILLEKIKTFNPDLVGFTCMFSGQFPPIIKFAELTKKQLGDIPVVVGGMHPTLYAKEIIQNCTYIDYVVVGEGETQFSLLVSYLLEEEGVCALDEIDGLAYRQDGQVVFQPKTEFIENLDSLPSPAYDLINIQDYYHKVDHWHNPRGHEFYMTFPLLSSRSCPMRCNFCSNYISMGARLRPRSPMKVADEIQLLYEKFDQKHFSFMDDNVTLIKKNILKLCEELVKRKIDIQFETPNGVFLASVDEEVVDAMVNAGWVRGALAIESGSEYIRNQVMGKRLKQEKIYEVAELCRKHDQLYVKGAFMLGMPEETRETAMASYNLMRDLALDEYFVTNVMPYPGTRIFDQVRRDGLLVEEVDESTLWCKTGFHYHENRKFYIKPYNMEIEELAEFRNMFDELINSMKCKRLQRA